MIARLKRRGDWPHPTSSTLNVFRGCCLEVEPAETYRDIEMDYSDYRQSTNCNEPLFVITDGRYLALRPHIEGVRWCICSCYFIDDIEAFDSDFCDEEAKEGDLAFVQVPMTVQR